MRTNRSVVAGILTAALAASLLAGTGAEARQPGEPAPAGRAGQVDQGQVDQGQVDQVTLLSGDLVFLADGQEVTFRAGPGREDVTFLTEQRGEDVYVLPGDALPLLADGTVDLELFNVTKLREYGYLERLPLLVTPGDAAPAAAAGVAAAGARVTGHLSTAGALAVEAEPAVDNGLWRSLTAGAAATRPVARVALDGLLQPALDESVPQVGAPAAWAAGLDGTGVTVAVLDTGVDETHPDLAGTVVDSRNFTDSPDGDQNGHGTHVASTVAGSGALSEGQYVGVAPGVRLLAGKVCHEDGCPQSSILAGMQWAAEQGADVVNLSLGGPEPRGEDPVADAVDRLTDEFGALFVVAAGNGGADRTISSPGTADGALTVGAVDKQDQPAWFSSRGPRRDGALKPDLTAPGAAITAAIPGERYGLSDGTSMATPHVSGAAAILVQQRPDATPAELKALLMASTDPHPEAPPHVQGNGRLDVARAIDQAVTTSPASVSFPRQVWPHEDTATETLTYHNPGTADLPLTLSMTSTGPPGLFALSDTTLTVPAGGSAPVTITADPRGTGALGYFGGHLVATGPDGDPVASTAFGIDLEEESYDVTLVHTDRRGAPTSSYRTVLAGPLDLLSTTEVTGGAPMETRRMPAGEYFLYSWINEVDPETGREVWTALKLPALDLTSGDVTVEVDARLAETFSIDVEGRPVAQAYAATSARVAAAGTALSAETTVIDGSLYLGQLGDPEATVPYLTTTVRGTWGVPGPDGRVESSPEVYHLTDFVDGRFPTGYARELTHDELARVEADYAQQVDGSDVALGAIGIRLDPFAGGSTFHIPFDAPTARTEYYTTGGGVVWSPVVSETVQIDEHAVELVALLRGGENLALQPGGTYRWQWNHGVYGPALTRDTSGIAREGQWLTIGPDIYSDAGDNYGQTQAFGTITVYRDGELLAERFWLSGLTSFVPVPDDTAQYRVELDAGRVGTAPLSTRTQVAWTFTAGAAEGRVPQLAVRFRPPLDGHNTAPAGRVVRVPVSLDSTHGADLADRATRLTVEVSFDDGATWRRRPVVPTPDGGHDVVVAHPRGAEFVSLRATATDRDGNRVEQTIIRAYQLR